MPGFGRMTAIVSDSLRNRSTLNPSTGPRSSTISRGCFRSIPISMGLRAETSGPSRRASMSAPGQFERARELAAAAVRAAPATDVVGVMTFGAATDVVALLSPDRSGALRAIAALTPGAGATRYGGALARAVETLGNRPGRIVVVTDHKSFDYDAMVAEAEVIVDTRNAIKTPGRNVFKLGAPRPESELAGVRP